MGSSVIAYDEAAYAVDLALEHAARGDTVGIDALVSGAVKAVVEAPYPALVLDARRFGLDAVSAARTGEFARSADYLTLLRHVVEDMDRLTTASLFASA